MNAQHHAAAGYAQTTRAVGTPRTIEYQLFQRMTAKLSALQDVEEPDIKVLAAAIADNTKLWTALAADLLSDGNGMSPALRGQLISLAEFSRKHGSAVLRRKADLAPLIDVNTAIMRGLRTAQQVEA